MLTRTDSSDLAMDPSLQAAGADHHPANPHAGIWPSSVSPSAHSSSPAWDPKDDIARRMSSTCFTTFNSPFSPMDSASRQFPVSHAGHGCNFDLATQMQFQNNSPLCSTQLEDLSTRRSGSISSKMDTPSFGNVYPASDKQRALGWPPESVPVPLANNAPIHPGQSTSSVQSSYSAARPLSSHSTTMLNNTRQPRSRDGVRQPRAGPAPHAFTEDEQVSQRSSTDSHDARLEQVLEAIDDAGFDSVESMTAAYYSSTFPAGSPLASAQALSKKRHLKRMLLALYESSKSWDAQECHNYREGIMQIAEDIIVEEVQSLDLHKSNGARSRQARAVLHEQLDSIFTNQETYEATKETRKLFKQHVSSFDCRLRILPHPSSRY